MEVTKRRMTLRLGLTALRHFFNKFQPCLGLISFCSFARGMICFHGSVALAMSIFVPVFSPRIVSVLLLRLCGCWWPSFYIPFRGVSSGPDLFGIGFSLPSPLARIGLQ